MTNTLLLEVFCVVVITTYVIAEGQPLIGYKHKNKTSEIGCNLPCIQCKEHVNKKQIAEDPLVCDENHCVKNSSCCLCDGCKTPQDVRDFLKHTKTPRKMRCGTQNVTVTADCCLLSQMENLRILRMAPSEEGRYNCYKATVHKDFDKPPYEPLKSCPPGKKGEQCQEPNTQPFSCRCQPHIHIFLSESMPQCNPDEQIDKSVRCYLNITRNDIAQDCECQLATDLKDEKMEDCSVSSTGTPQYNSKNTYFVMLYVLMLYSILLFCCHT